MGGGGWGVEKGNNQQQSLVGEPRLKRQTSIRLTDVGEAGEDETLSIYPHVILPAARGLQVKVGVFGAAGKGGRDEEQEPKSQEETPGEEKCEKRLMLDSFL